LLHRRLLLGQLGDEALAGGDVHPVAERPVVVLDPAVDLAEPGLRGAWIQPVLPPPRLDPRPELALQLVPTSRVAEAGLEGVDDDALDPGHVERQGLADFLAFEQVARAEVAQVRLLLALVVDVLAAPADEGVAAAVAGDQAPEQVVDVLVCRRVDAELAVRRALTEAVEQLAVDERRVGVAGDHAFLGLGDHAAGAPLLLGLHPHEVADVDRVREDVAYG